MAPDDERADEFGEPERLDTTPTPGPPSRVRALVLGGAVATAGVLVAVTALSGVFEQSAPQPGSVASTRTPSPSRSVAFPTPAQPTPRPSPPAVFSSSGFLADQDLVVYASGDRVLYRIDTRRGRVTRTATDDAGEISSLVALPDRVLLVSEEAGVPYEVVDGRPPSLAGGRLTEGSQFLPGSEGRIWLVSDTVVNGRIRALLLDPSGRRVYERVTVPENGVVSSDGAGGVFWDGIGGTYRVTKDGSRRVTPGRVVGTSRTGYLAVECSARYVCASYAYDHAGGDRRKVGPAVADGFSSGVLSPDGRFVALRRWNDVGPSVAVVDIRSGRDLASFKLSDDYGYIDQPATWLRDGRLLLVVDGRLTVYDPYKREKERIKLRLPPLRQLAVRSAG